MLSIDQTNEVYTNDDHGRVCQNCTFHDPLGGGLKTCIILMTIINLQCIVLKVYNAAFLTNC